ncbi:potassium channel protein [Pseudalkalibacillus caeni]|uniref:Potassium channel protein n=2 Tax=Exobacillus caeni TaxID=2574798 RepID=A0A5R9FFL4_9BACL|nr:potassium channel protein [Pseudalkalibacillus caeni]
MFTTFFRTHILLQLISIILLVIFAIGITIHFVEPKSFPTIFDGVWWALVTAATVGYGDFVPKSTLGRLIGMFLILSGAGFVTFYMAKLASSSLMGQTALRKGEREFRREHHLIIVGWNERSRSTIDYLLKARPGLSIVLIDNSLMENPLEKEGIHFIKGNPCEDRTLKKANAEKAETILITADQYKNENEMDMQSILTLLTVEGLNPSIYSIVEILSPEQIVNAQRAGADEVIQSANISSTMMINSLFHPGISPIFLDILTNINPNKITYETVSGEFAGKEFCDVSKKLIDKDALLIGIKRDEELKLNPAPPFPIKEGDRLLIIQK